MDKASEKEYLDEIRRTYAMMKDAGIPIVTGLQPGPVGLVSFIGPIDKDKIQLTSKGWEEITNMDNGHPVQCAGIKSHYCLRIKDPDTGVWIDDGYVQVSKWHGMTVSHGVCPDCLAKYKTDRAAEKLRKGE